MTTSAIMMMSIAMLLTWGGAAVCIAIALKHRNTDRE
ncbi:MetS family NSS transporter small subunit [Shewanella psychrotolerans]|nr:MetS family NSS transporter small subunit [Shewanella psychrotolerans]QYK00545.1 MetS family NSS transporter small subunit [Shewanella psychrotolerans]